MLGKYCSVSVCRPVGYVDTAYGFTYPVNFGFANVKRVKLNKRIGAYILGINHPVREFDGRVIAVLTNKQTGENLLVVAPKSKRYIVHEIDDMMSFLKPHFDYELQCYFERSCGAVLFHEVDGKIRYLLIKNKRSSHWSFPKGHVEKGESDIQAAIREVQEETGITPHIIDGFKAKSEYSIQHRIEKTVFIFAASCDSTKTIIQESEIEDYRWLEYSTAIKNLKFDNDKNILQRVNKFLKKNNYI